MSPFGEATANAALANLDDALAILDSAFRVNSDRLMFDRIGVARARMLNARAKLADALSLEEMAVTAGDEDGEEAAE